MLAEIISFNRILNTYGYGYVVNGKALIDPDDYSRYKTISPEDFAKYKVGICWDYVAFEYTYFMKYFKNKPRCFYIQCNTGNTDNYIEPTHTWLCFERNDKICSFESAWASEQEGIREFSSLEKMLKHYKKAMLTYVSEQDMLCTGYTVREFKQPSKFGLSSEVKKAVKTGSIIEEELALCATTQTKVLSIK